jgi:uncharacterized phiE125 gp8 family phage protein
MKIKQITAPYAEPIHLDEAKDHLLVTGDDQDAVISRIIMAARSDCEDFTGRQFVTATYDLYLDVFPDVIEVPLPPLVSVTSIAYEDTAGDTQTMTSTDYVVDTISEPGLISLAYGESWPATYGEANAIRVRFVCGHVLPVTVVASTDVWTAHGRSLTDTTLVRLTNSGGSLPIDFEELTDYYVRDASGATFKLALTSGGAAIDVETAGEGTHFIGELPPEIRSAMLIQITDLYEHRQDKITGTVLSSLDQRNNLLWKKRVHIL